MKKSLGKVAMKVLGTCVLLVAVLALTGLRGPSTALAGGRPHIDGKGKSHQGQTGRVTGFATRGNAPVEDAVVFLVKEDGRPPLASASPNSVPTHDTVVIDQARLSFIPEVSVVSPGTVVEFLNSDGVRHNVFKAAGPGEPFDLGTYRGGERRAQTFDAAGMHVILCHLHPEMFAHVMVVPSELRARTGPDGAFEIPNVPPGEYVLRAWHPRHRLAETRVRVGADQVSDVRIQAAR